MGTLQQLTRWMERSGPVKKSGLFKGVFIFSRDTLRCLATGLTSHPLASGGFHQSRVPLSASQKSAARAVGRSQSFHFENQREKWRPSSRSLTSPAACGQVCATTCVSSTSKRWFSPAGTAACATTPPRGVSGSFQVTLRKR